MVLFFIFLPDSELQRSRDRWYRGCSAECRKGNCLRGQWNGIQWNKNYRVCSSKLGNVLCVLQVQQHGNYRLSILRNAYPKPTLINITMKLWYKGFLNIYVGKMIKILVSLQWLVTIYDISWKYRVSQKYWCGRSGPNCCDRWRFNSRFEGEGVYIPG